MTEIGMALSNRIDGTRFPGSHPQPCHEGVAMHDCLDDHATRCVGWPLPDVEVKQDEVLCFMATHQRRIKCLLFRMEVSL